MSGGLWLWKAPYVVFYKVWRPREVPPLTTLRDGVGPLKKTNTVGSEDRGWEPGEVGNDECLEDCGGKLHVGLSLGEFGGACAPSPARADLSARRAVRAHLASPALTCQRGAPFERT